MIRSCVYWPAGEAIEALEGAELEAAMVDQNSVVWVDFEAPDEASRREASEFLVRRGVHPLIVEDCFSPVGRAKIEEIGETVAVFLHGAELRAEEIEHVRIAAVFGATWIVTVRTGFVEAVEAAWKRVMRRGKEVMARGPDAVLHAVADDLVDDYVPILRQLNGKIVVLEKEVFQGEAPEGFLEKAHAIRTSLLRLRHIATPQREILVALSSRDFASVHRHNLLYFRDVFDHAIRAIEAIDLERALVGDIIQIHFAQSSSRLSEVMKRLTVITTIFMPLSVVAGIGGMSEWSMMTGPENWYWSYPLFGAGLVAMGYGTYRFLHAKRWI